MPTAVDASSRVAIVELCAFGERLSMRAVAAMREHVPPQTILRHVFDTHNATLVDVRALIRQTMQARERARATDPIDPIPKTTPTPNPPPSLRPKPQIEA